MDPSHFFASMECGPSFKSKPWTEVGWISLVVPVVFGFLVNIDIKSFPGGQDFALFILMSFDPFEFASNGERLHSASNIL